MAKIEDLDIHYVAKLARLELSKAEVEKFDSQLGSILEYFQKLGEVNTDGIEPTAHANPIFDVLREDLEGSTLSPEEALKNAPSVNQQQVEVPRVVES